MAFKQTSTEPKRIIKSDSDDEDRVRVVKIGKGIDEEKRIGYRDIMKSIAIHAPSIYVYACRPFIHTSLNVPYTIKPLHIDLLPLQLFDSVST